MARKTRMSVKMIAVLLSGMVDDLLTHVASELETEIGGGVQVTLGTNENGDRNLKRVPGREV